jgi:hypothetical protein
MCNVTLIKIVTMNPGHRWLTPVILATQEADQEDRNSKPAQANSLRPYLEKPFTKNRIGGVAQGEGPEFKPQYQKKKKL